jgi:hypothetical protein
MIPTELYFIVNKCSSAQNFKHCGFTLVYREVMMENNSSVEDCFISPKNVFLFKKLLNLTKIVDFDDEMNISEWIHSREIPGSYGVLWLVHGIFCR